jgi:hypothetical protein
VLIGLTVYGEAHPDPTPNLRGRVYQQYDTAVAQMEQLLATSDSVLEPGTLQVIRQSLMKIDKAGTYQIFWSGFFDGGESDASNGRPSLDLVINNSIVALGCGRQGHLNNPATVPVQGFHLAVLHAFRSRARGPDDERDAHRCKGGRPGGAERPGGGR